MLTDVSDRVTVKASRSAPWLHINIYSNIKYEHDHTSQVEHNMKKRISYSKKNNTGAVEACTEPHSSERMAPLSAPEEILRIGTAS